MPNKIFNAIASSSSGVLYSENHVKMPLQTEHYGLEAKLERVRERGIYSAENRNNVDHVRPGELHKADSAN